jgi:hypothetical protein
MLRNSIPLVLVAALLGCQTPPLAVWTKDLDRPRFTRVHFRPDGVTLRSSNVLDLPMTLPAASPAVITEFTDRQVNLKIREVVYTLHAADGRFDTSDRGIARFIDKYLVESPEEIGIEMLGPAELLPSLRVGTVVRGMTKEQVYVTLGPPQSIGEDRRPALNLSREEILQSDHWTYTYQKVVDLIPQRVVYVFAGGKMQYNL